MNYYGATCAHVNGWSTAVAVTTAAVTGAAVASANTNAAAANANANATTTASAPTYSIGQLVGALPAGCITPTVQGTTYYLCGNTWFSAAYGANGVYYRVVTAP